MSLYVKVFTGFYSHRKTFRLRAALGDDAFWIPPRIWAYAADNQPDGDFRDYSAEEIAMLVGYTKDATSMLAALLDSGFLDQDKKIHNWFKHNSYHQTFSDRAKKAADTRWEKERTKEREKDKEKTRDDKSEHDSSIQEAYNKHAPSIQKQARAVEDFVNHSQSTLTQFKGDCIQKLKDQLQSMFKRRTMIVWPQREEQWLCEISNRAESLTELAEMVVYRAVNPKYFPRSIAALLENWDTTLDQARNYVDDRAPRVESLLERECRIKAERAEATYRKEQDADNHRTM